MNISVIVEVHLFLVHLSFSLFYRTVAIAILADMGLFYPRSTDFCCHVRVACTNTRRHRSHCSRMNQKQMCDVTCVPTQQASSKYSLFVHRFLMRNLWRDTITSSESINGINGQMNQYCNLLICRMFIIHSHNLTHTHLCEQHSRCTGNHAHSTNSHMQECRWFKTANSDCLRINYNRQQQRHLFLQHHLDQTQHIKTHAHKRTHSGTDTSTHNTQHTHTHLPIAH